MKKYNIIKNICLIGPPGSGKGSYGKLISKALDVPLISTSDVLKRHGLIFSNTTSSSSSEDSNDNNISSSNSSIKVGDGNSNGGSDRSSHRQQHPSQQQHRPQQQDGNDDDEKPCHSLSGKLIDDSVVCETLLKEFQHMEIEDEKKNKSMTMITMKNRHQTKTKTMTNGYILDGFPRTLQQIDIMKATWPYHLQIDGAIKLAVPDVVCQQKLEGRRLCLKCSGNYNVANVHYYEEGDGDDDGGDSNDSDGVNENIHHQIQKNEKSVSTNDPNGRWWNLPAYLPEQTTIEETFDSFGTSSSSSPGRGGGGRSKFVCGCDPTVDWMTRHDDEHDVVLRRLKIYHEHMDPILNYFDVSGKADDDDDEEKGDVPEDDNNYYYNNNAASSQRRRSRLLKLYPYNGFDDVPKIIDTVQNWIGMDRGTTGQGRGA